MGDDIEDIKARVGSKINRYSKNRKKRSKRRNKIRGKGDDRRSSTGINKLRSLSENDPGYTYKKKKSKRRKSAYKRKPRRKLNNNASFDDCIYPFELDYMGNCTIPSNDRHKLNKSVGNSLNMQNLVPPRIIPNRDRNVLSNMLAV